MRLRAAPRDAAGIWAPAIVREAPTNECSMVARRDGTIELYSITKPASDSVSVMRSTDGGLSWSEPQREFSLPGRAYYAVKALEAQDGTLHAVAHVYGEGAGGYRGRLYEVYHALRPPNAAAWSEPRRIVPGYVGSIRGFTQLAGDGRLLLAVARAIPAREKAPSAGPDFGWNDTFVYFSDGGGGTWRQSPDQLTLALSTPNATRYGAIEPVVLGLRGGGAWMLVRDRGGRFWQSISADGERWPALERSPFISSDSPAELLRLRDGRIVLFFNACQNWSDPRSYAMGGREVLHAAISSDEGRTWRGFREVLHDTDTIVRGDRGSAYPSAAETRAGKVVFASGQGEGKRAIVAFDPRWLEETTQSDDLERGATSWTAFGGTGLRVQSRASRGRALLLPLRLGKPGGALWNFPLADSGELSLQIVVPAGVASVQLSLNDHFNRIDDTHAAEHAVFTMALPAGWSGDAHEHTLRLQWRSATRDGEVTVDVDGRRRETRHVRRPAQMGINYLRVESQATTDEGSVTLSQVSARSD